MAVRIHTPGIYLWSIKAISLLAPREFSLEWRREWEAEIVSRWLLLKEWDNLNVRSRLDLFKRVQGSFLDALCFQRSRTTLALVALNVLVAIATGFGAFQEFIVRGIGDRQMQPLLISLVAIIISILFTTSGIALLRQWSTARRLITFTGILSILLHVYGVLPPHRNMGFFVLIVGAGYGFVMLVVFEWSERRNLIS